MCGYHGTVREEMMKKSRAFLPSGKALWKEIHTKVLSGGETDKTARILADRANACYRRIAQKIGKPKKKPAP
jgi:hypothetical protein